MLPTETTVDTRDRGATVALLPIGSHEQHGPHLPLSTDTLIACAIAREIAAAYPVRLLPPITISCSHEHAAWPGTVSISARTLYAVITDIADSLRRSGVPNLVLVNAHGGNYVLSNIVQEATGLALFPGSADWSIARNRAGIETSARSDMHAGELETSILLHTNPEVLKPGWETSDHLAEERPHLLTLGLSAYTESGVVGRPSLASAHKGAELLAGLVETFAHTLAILGR
ncbi:creatininase family protein [Crossiella cryophila]|uniref:Creatinine amidohydrolase n=1 Tax=Crossiella cryophila TaxID=43355 RepID=A0A7W7FUL3_9PSEU|nr:creatininase family protein [Crossiella cryophila]MBB4678170.1 creatinine amidohydrolase [Crossiella cryophila]